MPAQFDMCPSAGRTPVPRVWLDGTGARQGRGRATEAGALW